MATQTQPAPGSHHPLVQSLHDVVARWPLTAFAVVTLVISWPFGLLPPGPSLAALVVAAVLDGRAGVRSLLATTTIWRVGVRWYVVALLGPVVAVAAAVGLLVAFGGEIQPGSSLFDLPELGRLFALQVFGVFAGPWEELGWRGYALPRLLRRTSPLLASLGLGVFWALWHVPMFASGDVPWVDGLLVVVISILFTAVFLRTRGSVLIAFLMHAAINASAGVAIELFAGGDRTRMYWALIVVASAIAAVVVGLRARWWTQRPADPDHGPHAEQPPPYELDTSHVPAEDVPVAGPAGAIDR
ncbi:CPBP family intramembrane glutamic endopeptidase [Salsipaludibacter albus]|uniref:CPBP family intramembrane glutamic endopeptidase n=1 Tax=Salsipaludibacter albus TaxID=2849650 RepID=UPI001EE3FBD2|nr:type II CAAX endopeptidase family protein [Salsipaludibacter albus]MBY5162137.1 CPBP family intramembrane metalloprotease [Salsipaludibacter albus]